MADTTGEPYRIGGEPSSETEGDSGARKITTGDDFKTAVAESLSKIPISKLFVILSMVVYAIVAYSKKDKGVKTEDISVLIFFCIFVVLVFIFLIVSSHVYRKYLKSVTGKKLSFSVAMKGIYNFLLEKSFTILVLLATIFIYLIYKTFVLNFVNNLVVSFIKF